MISKRIVRQLVVAVLLIVQAPLLRATVWLVDDDGGPGVNFTDLQAAVLAAAPGDTILVAPGTYGPPCLKIDKPLRILGTGVDPYEVYLLCAPEMQVLGVLGSEPVVISNVSSAVRLRVTGCEAPVVLIDIALPVEASGASDLRIHGMRQPVYGSPYTYISAGSRLEAVACDFRGKGGKSPFNCISSGGTGGPGVSVNASRAHLSACTSTGGKGGSVSCSTFGNEYGGDGGNGISLLNSSLVFAGAPGAAVTGGAGGDFLAGGCWLEGYGGTGLWASSSLVLHSRVRFTGGAGGEPCGSQLLAGAATSLFGSTVLSEVTPAQPILELLGAPGPGATVTLRLHAAPGASATLFLGRKAIVQPEPGLEVEQLCDRLRSLPLGIASAGQPLDHVLLLPSWMTPGTCLFAQAQVQLSTGEKFNTNSIPVLAR